MQKAPPLGKEARQARSLQAISRGWSEVAPPRVFMMKRRNGPGVVAAPPALVESSSKITRGIPQECALLLHHRPVVSTATRPPANCCQASSLSNRYQCPRNSETSGESVSSHHLVLRRERGFLHSR